MAMPCRSPPERLATVESTVMPTPRKPIASFRICSAIAFCRRDVDEAEAVGDLPADEEVAPERLLLGERLVLVDGLDRELVRHAHRVVAEVELPVADEDAPGGRREHPGQHLDQRRLSGAVVADQPDDLVAADGKVDVAERLDRAEVLLHPLEAHDMPVVRRCRALVQARFCHPRVFPGVTVFGPPPTRRAKHSTARRARCTRLFPRRRRPAAQVPERRWPPDQASSLR